MTRGRWRFLAGYRMQQLEKKKDKLDFIEIWNSCSTKIIEKSRQVIDWEKILWKYTSGKEFTFRIYNEPLQVHNENNPI